MIRLFHPHLHKFELCRVSKLIKYGLLPMEELLIHFIRLDGNFK